MPKKISKLQDIERGVIMRVNGSTFLQIAISLTEHNVNEMEIPSELKKVIMKVNATRKRRDNMLAILKKINEQYELDDTMKTQLLDKIVGEGRITWLARTQRWIEYQEEYQKTVRKQFFDKFGNKE